MALADYRLCDQCGCKTFYDAEVNYEAADLGDWKVLCKDCAETHQCIIKNLAALKAEGDTILSLIGQLEAMRVEKEMLRDGLDVITRSADLKSAKSSARNLLALATSQEDK